MRTRVWLAMLGMWVTQGLYAQTAPTFTLEQAVSYAQKNSTKVRTTQLELADAKAQVREYTAIGLPQVNAGVDYNYFIELPTLLREFFLMHLKHPYIYFY